MSTPVTTEGGAVAGGAQVFALKQNWPNPFNLFTDITYLSPSSVYVSLKVYDLLGQEVVTLVEGYREVGLHRVSWDGLDREGRKVSSGIYLYRLRAEGLEETKLMTLVR